MTARTGMANLITRLRALVADEYQWKQDTATGDGATKVYWLTQNPQASGGTVSQGGTVTGTASYTWNTTHGRLSLNSAPALGVSVVVEYLTAQFTDDQLQETLDQHVFLVDSEPLTWNTDIDLGGTARYFRNQSNWRDLEESTSGTLRWDVRDAVGGQYGTSSYTPDYVTGILQWAADRSGTAYYLTARSYDLYAAAADIWDRKASGMSNWYQVQGDGQTFSRQQAWEHAVKMAAQMRQRAGRNGTRSSVVAGRFQRTDLAGV